jgi:hypothetical protein
VTDVDDDLWPPGWDATPESIKEQRKRVTEQRHLRDYLLSVAEETVRLRARREAKRIVEAENVTEEPIPAPTFLDDLIEEDDEQDAWRMEGLWPAGGTVLFAAGAKAGKTTSVGNVIRCLVDGDRFLGVHVTDPVMSGQTVGVLDYEMPRNKVKQWLRDQGIKNRQSVVVWTERGRAHLFDPRDESCRAKWVNALMAAAVRVWLIDCLSPILSALGIDENNNTEVGAVLDGINAIAAAAGVFEVLLIHHMGHGAERSRGASRLVGWPDVNWRLMRQRDERDPNAEPAPDAPRFFAAYGRDVDVREGRLVYEPSTRHLTYVEGGRKQDEATANLRKAMVEVRDHPGESGRQIETRLQALGVGRDPARAALKTAVDKGYILVESRGRNRTEHTITATGRMQIAATSLNPPSDSAITSGAAGRERQDCPNCKDYYIEREAWDEGVRLCTLCLQEAA